MSALHGYFTHFYSINNLPRQLLLQVKKMGVNQISILRFENCTISGDNSSPYKVLRFQNVFGVSCSGIPRR